MFRIRLPSAKHTKRTIYQGSDLVVNAVRELQDLCGRHTSLIFCQLVQPLQSVVHLLLANELLQKFS
jgi:hypothetical protein